MIRKRSLRELCMVLCAVLMLACASAPNTAHAAGSTLEVSGLTVTPDSLPSTGGTVKLSGTLINKTDADITSVTLYVGSNQLDINQTIAKNGGTHPFSWDITLASSDIGVQQTLNVTWPSGSNNYTFVVSPKTETVSLQWSRTASSTTVMAGDTVKLTYNFKNTGTATITNLKLTDSCVAGTIISGLTLDPGESYQKTTSVVVSADTSSVPTVTYTASGNSHTETKDALKISLGTADLSISATADKTQVNSGDTVTFTIILTNNSAVAVSGISVTDDLGNPVKSGINIAATTGSTSRTYSLTYTATMTTGRAVSFTVTYPSGSGTNASKTSDPITIYVLQAGSPLTIDVSASPVAMAFPGDVTFTVTVTNISGQTISNINVSEPTLGPAGSILSLAPGGQQQISKVSRLSQPGTFTFTATGTDPSGATITPVAKDVSVTSQVGSATPETVNPTGSDTLHTLFIIMLVIIALAVILGIVLAVLIINDKRKGGPKGGGSKRKSNEDLDDFDFGQAEENEEEIRVPSKRQRRQHPDDDSIQTSMEQTQPILRSAIAERPDQSAHSLRRRRGFSLDDDESFSSQQGIVEEEQVYGPAPTNARVNSETADAERRRTVRRPELSQERGSLRRPKLIDEEDEMNIDRPYDMDTNVTHRHSRSPMSDAEQDEKPELHLHYENEDDDLPPLRPRRRR